VELEERILRHLVTPGGDTRFDERYLVDTIALQAGCRRHEISEALWALVADGLVCLDPNGQNLGTDN
jgi:DNA-binding GntR family transcriptional regulator